MLNALYLLARTTLMEVYRTNSYLKSNYYVYLKSIYISAPYDYNTCRLCSVGKSEDNFLSRYCSCRYTKNSLFNRMLNTIVSRRNCSKSDLFRYYFISSRERCLNPVSPSTSYYHKQCLLDQLNITKRSRCIHCAFKYKCTRKLNPANTWTLISRIILPYTPGTYTRAPSQSYLSRAL